MDYLLAQMGFIKNSLVSEFLFCKEAVVFSFRACYSSVSRWVRFIFTKGAV